MHSLFFNPLRKKKKEKETVYNNYEVAKPSIGQSSIFQLQNTIRTFVLLNAILSKQWWPSIFEKKNLDYVSSKTTTML